LEESRPENIDVAASSKLGSDFYEKIWQWVTDHSDIRIFYQKHAHRLSLAKFELLESQAHPTDGASSDQSQASFHKSKDDAANHTLFGSFNALSSLGGSLRQRLLVEGFKPTPLDVGSDPMKVNNAELGTTIEPKVERRQRNFPETSQIGDPVFDPPLDNIKGPRLFASQNRIWQALTGHSMDLKKIPGSEFTLLSIIAARGSRGIAQPELQRLSGQDKRSVPHRTDELAKKGYILKRPIQEGRARTSLCIHTKFFKESHYLNEPQSMDQVFGARTFVLSGFVYMLHKLLQENIIVQVRDLRRHMGVSVERWNGRAVRGAIVRLEQTGFIQRLRVRKRRSAEIRSMEKWAVCIKMLRDPTEDDIKNLSFKRITTEIEPMDDEPPDDYNDGDGFMRDMELAMMDESGSGNADGLNEVDRIPPQWTPDRPLGNIVFDATELAGPDGGDAAFLRDRTTGLFWKRPIETFIGRLTDCWEISQPAHVRHLAIVRDTALTNEKKRVFYVYRTYDNFDKAVAAGDVTWEALDKEDSKKGGRSKLKTGSPMSLDDFGFQPLDPNDFHRRTGSSTLAEASSAISLGRRTTPHWDNALTMKMGYVKPGKEHLSSNSKPTPPRTSIVTAKKHKALELKRSGENEVIPSQHSSNDIDLPTQFSTPRRNPKTKEKQRPLLTKEERIALGLPPRGRLGEAIEEQIRAYRKQTGDPNSLPDVLVRPDPTVKVKYSRRRGPPILSQEERKARGLPVHGRLPADVTSQILKEKGRLTEASSKNNGGTVGIENGTSLFPQTLSMEQPAEHYRDPGSSTCNLDSQADPRIQKRAIDDVDEDAEHPRKRNKHDSGYLDAQADPCIQKRAIDDVDDVDEGIENPRKRNKSDSCNLDSQANPHIQKRAIDDVDEITENPRKRNRTDSSDPDSTQVAISPASQGQQERAVDSDTTSQNTAHPTVPRSLRPHQKFPEQMTLETPSKTLSQSELRNQDIKDKYENRDKSGVYVNPFATYSGGRGRPKKMYLLTFKLPGLQNMSWFTSEGYILSPLAPSTSSPHTRTQKLASGSSDANFRYRSSQINPELSTSTSPNVLINQRTASPATSIPEANAITITTPTPVLEARSNTLAPEHRPASGEVAFGAQTNGADKSEQQELAWPQLVSTLGSEAQGTSTKQVSSYISPYAPIAPATTSSEHGVSKEGQITLPVTHSTLEPMSMPESLATSNGHNASYVLSKEAQPSSGRRNSKKRGVVLGRGNAFHARTSVIRHIFNLCNGVFPANGEIYPIFESLWTELGPKKISCPDRGTIRKAFNSMTGSELVVMRIIVPGSDPGISRNKALAFYKHLSPTSNEVERVKAGMIKAFPGRYWPPEVHKYWKPDPKRKLPSLPEIDESLARELYPSAAKNFLDSPEVQEASNDDTFAERDATSRQQSSTKRGKLVSLNSGGRRKGNSKASQKGRTPLAENAQTLQSEKSFQFIDVSQEDIRLAAQHRSLDAISFRVTLASHVAALMNPIIRHDPITNTFSTHFGVAAKRGVKRVRIDQLTDKNSRKKARHDGLELEKKIEAFCVEHQDMTDPSEEDQSGRSKKKRNKQNKNAQSPAPDPTIVERLSGMTGNPNEPDYEPPPRKRGPTWSESKNERRKYRHYQLTKEKADRKYPEVVDPISKFKKLCFALVIATSMSDDESIDWSIVERVYADDRKFNLPRTKKVWSWMQKNMATQIQAMIDSFQSAFLEAYEEGKLEPIADPATYNWTYLVRWAIINCPCSEPPLPNSRQSLSDCQFDLLEHEVFDRKIWHTSELANTNRAQRLLNYTFGAPLHGKQTKPPADVEVKARSWIRSNIATLKHQYNKNVAFEKLGSLPESVLKGVVSDFIYVSFIKQWSIKTLKPGRNFRFAPAFAKNYRQTFELEDFMTAVKFKKELDVAFLNAPPDQRIYPMSRVAKDGAVMVVLSLASDGRVKLLPRLPPIKDRFGVEQPHISVWGFLDRHYAHRKLDRERLFWMTVDIIPTETYEFGNPLRPTSLPSTSEEVRSHPGWHTLPEPPLPGRSDSDVPLPIWSSFDGQAAVWPWWNRILNLVIQSMVIQPGVTGEEIHRHFTKYAVELFEIQHVLDWLVTVKAARKSAHGTYEALPGFWAVFGDRLIDEEEDEFGEHVKRNPANKKWRSDYNLRYASQNNNGPGQEPDSGTAAIQEAARQEILHNARSQYKIARQLEASTYEPPSDPNAGRIPASESQPRSLEVQPQDVEMRSFEEHRLSTQTHTPAPVVAENQPLYQQPEQFDVEMPSQFTSINASTHSLTPVATTPSISTPDVEMIDEDIDADGEWDDEY